MITLLNTTNRFYPSLHVICLCVIDLCMQRQFIIMIENFLHRFYTEPPTNSTSWRTKYSGVCAKRTANSAPCRSNWKRPKSGWIGRWNKMVSCWPWLRKISPWRIGSPSNWTLRWVCTRTRNGSCTPPSAASSTPTPTPSPWLSTYFKRWGDSQPFFVRHNFSTLFFSKSFFLFMESSSVFVTFFYATKI